MKNILYFEIYEVFKKCGLKITVDYYPLVKKLNVQF